MKNEIKFFSLYPLFISIFIFTFFTSLLGYIFYINITSRVKPLHQNKDITIKSEPMAKYVFLFVLDGARYDSLLDVNNAPFINKYLEKSLLLTGNYVNFPSGTQQGITEFIAGCKPGTFSWMLFNTYREKVPVESIVDTCKDRNIPVLLLVNRPWWNEFFPGGENFEVIGACFHNTKIIGDETLKTVEKLDKYKNAFIVVHLEVSDLMGHEHGGNSQEYKSAIKLEDEIINKTINSLNNKNLLKDSTIIITSDHGHLDKGGHGGQENVVLHTPLIFSGKGIKKGITNEETNILDITPTISYILGTHIPSYSHGKILYNIFDDSFLPESRIAQYNLYILERDYNQLTSEFNFKSSKIENALKTSIDYFNKKEYDSSLRETKKAMINLLETRQSLMGIKNIKKVIVRIVIVFIFITFIISLLGHKKGLFDRIVYITAIITGGFSICLTIYQVYIDGWTFSEISRSYPHIVIMVVILSLLDGIILWYFKSSPENVLNIYIMKSILYITAFIPYFIKIGPGIWPYYINHSSSLIIFSLLMLSYPFIAFPVALINYVCLKIRKAVMRDA